MLTRSLILTDRTPFGPELISHVPLSWRAGRGYGSFVRRSHSFEGLSLQERQKWIFAKIRDLVAHAERYVQFYSEFYDDHGFSSKQLKAFEDLGAIPIIRKSDLQKWSLDQRSVSGLKARLSNTGGTSGQPLTFLAEALLTAKESAYMDRIWLRRGYQSGCLKLRFRGANLGSSPYRYLPRQSEFLVNTYAGYSNNAEALERLLAQHHFPYLHGYPSTVAEFAEFCQNELSPSLRDKLKSGIRGVFLGSEYPAPHYRQVIDEVFGQVSISWYGHSEMAVLAGENGTPYQYEPFQSYGFTEAVKTDSGMHSLVATNYDGYACPFIRYDTGDLISPLKSERGILRSFKVKEGRVGDLITDRLGNRISLTSLIFGRHHGVFDGLEHLQVAQSQPGEVFLIATSPEGRKISEDWFWDNFDSTGVDLSFQVVFRNTPIRTSAGKVPLKVSWPIS